ncbi:MAG TPA: AI-2E family transporter [Terriglobales bacterium]|nr:AI-2E family transporter [Terriglobales bacterium]
MAQNVTNIGDRRAPEQQPDHNLPPPEVAVSRPHPRRKDWALYALGVGSILAICYFTEQVLVALLISVLLAFVLAPVSDLFSRLRIPRWLAAMLAVLLFVGVLSAVAYYSVNQASNLIEEVPKYSGRIREKVEKLVHKTEKLSALAPRQERETVKVRQTTDWTDLLSSRFSSITEVVLVASFIPFLVFFMLTRQEHARAATVGLFPLQDRHAAYTTLGLISKMVRSFIVGNLVIGLLIGAVSTLVFGLLGIPFFYFAGFLSGFFSLVPYLGVILALLPPLFMGVGHLSLAAIVWIAVTVFTLHVVAFNVLYPKMLGSRLRLNPLAVTVALLLWGWLWGAAGLLLAVPITAGMKIIFDHVQALKPWGAWLGEESPQNGAGRTAAGS